MSGARWRAIHACAMAALVVAALALHWRTAVRRSAGLLEHDEAISLLAAAGKSQRIDALYATTGDLSVHRAAELQHMLRPSPDIAMADVVASLRNQDIHPPLYFLALHGLTELWSDSAVFSRLLGTAAFLLAACIANLWIWPAASASAKWLGTAWLLTTPAMLNVATELRQYAMIYLAVITSIAALLLLWEEARPAWRTSVLLAVSPAFLLWLQWGTIVWVSVAFLAAMAALIGARRRQWKVLAAAVLGSALLLLPVIFWRGQIGSTHGRLTASPTIDFFTAALQPLCRGLADSWLGLPWTWGPTAASTAVAALVPIISLLSAWRRTRAADQAIWCASLLWGAAWVFLLANSLVPAHAVEPKQLAPLVLAPICLIVRSCSPASPQTTRRCCTALLAVMLFSLAARTAQTLATRTDAELVAALRHAQMLVIDEPRRGYLLPLADKMPPDAGIVFVSPASGTTRWKELACLLPADRLLLAEVGPHAAAAGELSQRLAQEYRDVRVLRKGPGKTVTEYRHGRAKAPSVTDSPHG